MKHDIIKFKVLFENKLVVDEKKRYSRDVNFSNDNSSK